MKGRSDWELLLFMWFALAPMATIGLFAYFIWEALQ